MKISYNAPIILTFALLSTIVLVLSLSLPENFKFWFLSPAIFNFQDPKFYTGILFHPLAHANWGHLLGNFSFILLIGPNLEEKYGSRDLLFMIILTAIFSGLLDAAFFDTYGIGASGIVFMMILLSSFTNMQSGKIPLTFIFVVILFIGQEIYAGFVNDDNVSQFAHILGGICGGIFGFFLGNKK